MPLIQIKRDPRKVPDLLLERIIKGLPVTAAQALSCEEGHLTAADIMIEVTDSGPFDRNLKDLNVRVLANDYPSRRGPDLAALDEARKQITQKILLLLSAEVSWYVWVFLDTASYGSDTEG